MHKSPTHLLALALPILLLGPLQLTGCLRRGPETPNPGGVYRSTSSGAQFDQAVNLIDQNGQTAGNIADLALRNIFRDPVESNLIFLTAGVAGAYVSTDDGQNWRRLNQPLPAATDITRLASGILLIAGTNADGEGIVSRSIDDGVSWERVLTIPALHRPKRQIFQVIKPPPPPPVYVSSIVADPFHPEQVYATTSTGDILVGEQSGKTWRALFRVTQEKRDPLTNRLVASIRSVMPSPHQPDELLLVTTTGDLVRLSGTGEEEVIERLEIPVSGTTIVDVIYVDQFPDAIFIGTTKGAFISRDRGVSWTELDLPIAVSTPLRNAVVRASPTNASRLLIAIDSIIYRSEDGGASFVTHTLNLPNHIVTDISIDPTNAARVLLIMAPAPS